MCLRTKTLTDLDFQISPDRSVPVGPPLLYKIKRNLKSILKGPDRSISRIKLSETDKREFIGLTIKYFQLGKEIKKTPSSA